MLSKGMRRSVLSLSLAMLCLAPLAAQAGTRGVVKAPTRAAAVHHDGIVQAFWRGLAQVFEKEGASIDPWGQPGSGIGTVVPGTDDEGASIDPSGAPHG
jgi:hypothetical protein